MEDADEEGVGVSGGDWPKEEEEGVFLTGDLDPEEEAGVSEGEAEGAEGAGEGVEGWLDVAVAAELEEAA